MQRTQTWMKELNEELFAETGVREVYQKHCGRLRLEEIFTTDSVYLAAHKCACGFRNRRDTQTFMQAASANSRKLCLQVLNGSFRPHYYREKVIIERGKQRVIKPPVFECKVVQKVLCDYLIRETLENRMIYHSYASVRGRGTEKLYRDVFSALLRNSGNPRAQIVRTDFKNYFASIDLELLGRIYRKYFEDSRVVELMELFADEKTGLSLGNEVSQIPASFFSSLIDHTFKDKMGVRDYFRYMDDVLFITRDSGQTEVCLEEMRRLAEQLALTLPMEKVCVIPMNQSFVYCKERFLYQKSRGEWYRLMNPAIVRNEVRKLRAFSRKLQAGEMSLQDVKAQYAGVVGMIRGRPNTWGAVKRLEEEYQQSILAIVPAEAETDIRYFSGEEERKV